MKVINKNPTTHKATWNNKEKNYCSLTKLMAVKRKMKKKMHNDVFKIGHTIVDIHNLKVVEAISIGLVVILSITAGTIYGYMMF